MNKERDLIRDLKLPNTNVLFQRTHEKLAQFSKEAGDILLIYNRVLESINSKIEEAISNWKFWCDIVIPKVIEDQEINHYFRTIPSEWWSTITCYGYYNWIYLKNNGFVDSLMKKFLWEYSHWEHENKGEHYKCVLVKTTSRYCIRIAWCKDDSHIKGFLMRKKI